MGRYAICKAADYARKRQVWSEPIGAHQGIAHPLAQAHVGVELARLATQRAAELFDSGQDAAEAANIAKLAAADAALAALDQAIQTHGGNGLATEYGLADLWFITRLMRTAPVSREMVLNFVARHSLGLPPSTEVAGRHRLSTCWWSAPGRRPAHRGPAHARGYRTLVVERLGHVGGRASTRDVDGFKVNNGAIVIETGGITEQTFAEVGAEFEYRSAGTRRSCTGWAAGRRRHRGRLGVLLSRLTRQGAKVLAGLADARQDEGCPAASSPRPTGWPGSRRTRRCTASSAACAGRSSRSALDELPARVFLTYFTRKSAFKSSASARTAPSASGSRWRGDHLRWR